MRIGTTTSLQVLLILFCASATFCIPVIRSYSGEWTENNSPVRLFMRESYGRSNFLVHGNCERLSPSNKNCTIIYEIFKIANNETKRTECPTGVMHNDVISMLATDRERVILSYVDRSLESGGNYYYNFRVIDMRSCQYQQGQIEVKGENIGGQPRVYLASLLDTSVVLHKDGAFDVFLPPYERACRDSARCRYAFDAKGESIGQPASYLDKSLSKSWINMISTRSAENFFAVVNKHVLYDSPRHLKVAYLESNGDAKDLVIVNPDQIKTYSMDFGYGYFGICWKNHSDGFACKQYDSRANAVVELKSTLPDFIDMTTKNLPNGGMLFITRETEKNDYTLGSVLPTGKLRHETKIKDFGCLAGSMTWESADISLDEDRSVCLTLLCTKRGFSGNWNGSSTFNRTMSYLRNCYSGEGLLS